MKKKDVLFKGCTRPPMIFGVPLTPFATALALCTMLSTWIHIFLIFAMLPLYAVMRAITKKDDQQFRLIFLKMVVILPSLKTLKFWQSSATTPLDFKKMKAMKISRRDIKVKK